MLAAVLIAAAVPAQYCRDLPETERLLCNQIVGTKGQIGELTGKVDEFLARQATLDKQLAVSLVRLERLEVDHSKTFRDVELLKQFRDELTGRMIVLGVLGGFCIALLTGYIMARYNRSLAKREKDNWGKG